MGARVTKEDEQLTVDLYYSNNYDVDVRVARLYTEQDEYIIARKRATIGAIAEKLGMSPRTVTSILKRNGVPRFSLAVDMVDSR